MKVASSRNVKTRFSITGMTMSELDWEERAVELLTKVVTQAKQGYPYGKILHEAKEAIDRAPAIKKAVLEALRGVYNE